MPTYEYICQKCGHQFETVQSMSESALAICPKDLCARRPWGKGKVKRAISGGAGLIFKGSGFYITDYRSEKYKEAARKDGPPAASDRAPAAETAKAKPNAASSESRPARTEKASV